MLIPYQVDTLFQRNPWTNIALLLLNCICFVLLICGVFPEDLIPYMVLKEWSIPELIGYQFMHADILHLLFNMIYLWVFGNAICAVMSGFVYPWVYLLLGAIAGIVHMFVSGSPVVGASGAISGIIGLYLAIYPLNKISCFYLFLFKGGTFEISGCLLLLFWFGVDLFSASGHGGHIAYWAHLGGTVAGFVAGIIFLQLGLIYRTNIDHPTVIELFSHGS